MEREKEDPSVSTSSRTAPFPSVRVSEENVEATPPFSGSPDIEKEDSWEGESDMSEDESVREENVAAFRERVPDEASMRCVEREA